MPFGARRGVGGRREGVRVRGKDGPTGVQRVVNSGECVLADSRAGNAGTGTIGGGRAYDGGLCIRADVAQNRFGGLGGGGARSWEGRASLDCDEEK